MGGQSCPKCGRGFLISKGKSKWRCTFCGLIKYKSPYGSGRDIPVAKEEDFAKTPEAPEIHQHGFELPKHPEGGYNTKEYQEMKTSREYQLRQLRKEAAIQKQLAKLRKNKYNKIKTLMIGGELWDVETGQRVEEKEKSEKKDEPESTPDRIIEDLVFKKSG